MIPVWGIKIPHATGGSEVKASACNVGDLGLIPGLGRSLGEGNGNSFQYSCLENPMDGGDWRATVHRVAGSDMTERLHFHFPLVDSELFKCKNIFFIFFQSMFYRLVDDGIENGNV